MRTMTRVACLIILLSMGLSTAMEKKPNYPPTKADPVVEKLHGVTITDPYRWIEEGDSPAVKDWTERQNAFTKSILEQFPGRAHIREQLDELLSIEQLGVPRPRKGKYFYQRRGG